MCPPRSATLALHASSPDSEAAASFSVGTRVEARYADDGNWYIGSITEDRGDGMLDVRWEDPDGGPETSICRREDVRLAEPVESYEVGDAVWAMFVDNGEWYTGIVTGDNGDGTLQVKWDEPSDEDPESSACMPAEMNRLFVEYKVGNDVEAVFSEDGQWYPGIVDGVNSDGKFQVRWDDPDGGPETSSCMPKDMKQVNVFIEYEVGDGVEARSSEDGQWYPGVVAEVLQSGNGIDISSIAFVVRWDDPGDGPESSTCRTKELRKVVIFSDYQLGDAVEAEFPEDGKWYPGTVEEAHENFSFQVRWEDPDGGPETTCCTPEKMQSLQYSGDDGGTVLQESNAGWRYAEEAEVSSYAPEEVDQARYTSESTWNPTLVDVRNEMVTERWDRDYTDSDAVKDDEDDQRQDEEAADPQEEVAEKEEDEEEEEAADQEEEVTEEDSVGSAKGDPESLLAELMGMDPRAVKEDYFDEESELWDMDGLESDVRLTTERQQS